MTRFDHMLSISITRVSDSYELPRQAKPGDAGVDLRSIEAHLVKAGGHRVLVRTGISVAIPEGYAGFVQPRSGLALKHGVTVLNTPGLIDSGYRGELQVILVNTDPTEDFQIEVGERIAQLVIVRVEAVEFQLVDSLDETARGSGGFGHTGTD